ncbi:hypothetical protein CLIB1423_06S03994 [[Candida] railenensis]|uniref:Uracil-DNA glycosylase-like domain-containing protein n=1 Tax=[Candida] railenensis TaxID=45579 RepID=A0A9P0QPQ1_9ASCO|nr:hypothetical protein CLIB1423_06S03994 [[Candida] railenensis]
MDDKIKSLIQAYSCETPGEIKPKVVDLKVSKKKKSSSPTKPKKLLDKSLYKDLPPSLKTDLTLVFIGFNPGLQSSLTQHHYAHFSNLFWKLFNQSKLIYSVVDVETALENDTFLQSRTTGQEVSKFTAVDDYDLLDYGIGFTDMVLRCTKAIDELTKAEKLENVPRLFDELKAAKPKFLCFIGKGIWEVIVTYLNGFKNFKLKDFKWGVQKVSEAEGEYRRLLLSLQKHLGYDDYGLYIFPNTSGLVTSLKFHEKLELWNNLVKDIYSRKT